MILVSIFLFFIFGCIFSSVRVDIENFSLNNKDESVKTIFSIKIKFKLYRLISIFSIKINNDYLSIFGLKIDYKKILKNDRIKKEFKKASSRFKWSNIKTLNPDFERMDIKINLGTNSIIITSFLVTICSVILSYIFKKAITKYDEEKYKYIIKPNYNEENKLHLELKGIFNIKTSNIIECVKYI